MITEALVRSLLDQIVDPCSDAAGCAAGLDAMGLVPHVAVTEGPAGVRVEAVVAVTEFGCLMGAPFVVAAEEKLRGLAGVADVVVRLDDRFDWTPDRMRPDYRARLEAFRAWRRRDGVPLVRHSRSSQGAAA